MRTLFFYQKTQTIMPFNSQKQLEKDMQFSIKSFHNNLINYNWKLINQKIKNCKIRSLEKKFNLMNQITFYLQKIKPKKIFKKVNHQCLSTETFQKALKVLILVIRRNPIIELQFCFSRTSFSFIFIFKKYQSIRIIKSNPK